MVKHFPQQDFTDSDAGAQRSGFDTSTNTGTKAGVNVADALATVLGGRTAI